MNETQEPVPLESVELIIEGRKPQAGRMKLLFWMLMAYLLLPLLTGFGWLLGMKIAYTEIVEVAGYQQFGWKFLLLTVLVMGLMLKGWSMYNYARFARAGRRHAPLPLSPQVLSEDFEKAFDVHTETLSDWQEAAYVSLRFDDSGHISGISPLDNPKLKPAIDCKEAIIIPEDLPTTEEAIVIPEDLPTTPESL